MLKLYTHYKRDKKLNTCSKHTSRRSTRTKKTIIATQGKVTVFSMANWIPARYLHFRMMDSSSGMVSTKGKNRIYSLLTSLPNNFAFSQSTQTNTRFLVLKHMLKYALLQNRYVMVPPLAKLPLSQLTSATAFSLPMYARLPWWEYSNGPICLTRRNCFCNALMVLKISVRSSPETLACCSDSFASSLLIVSVLANELKRRARKAPSWLAT